KSFPRLGGGTLHTAAFRTPGNKRWPELRDGSRNSFTDYLLWWPLAVHRSATHPVLSIPSDATESRSPAADCRNTSWPGRTAGANDRRSLAKPLRDPNPT